MAAKRLTLTFDNGPDPEITPQVLGELEDRGLPAIFFPVGERLEDAEHREVLATAAEAGYTIGNHTYSHPRPLGALSPAESVAEIERTDELLGELREPARLFRPSAGGGVIGPGVLNDAVVAYLLANMHTLVMWNLVCEDWKRPDGSWVDIALAGVADHDWTLLVLHDIDSGAMDHLGAFLDGLAERDVRVVADLPPAEVPISRGVLHRPIDHLLH